MIRLLKLFSLWRTLTIFRILLKYRLDHLLRSAPIPVWLRLLLLPFYLLPAPKLSRGQRIRQATEELGPLFIKFGQLISTRHDLLSDDIAEELTQLQDNVPPFDSNKAKQLIEASLHATIDDTFKDFNMTPLASASVAQVHEATLFDGTEVIIKVLRPNIRKIIEQDLGLLLLLATFVSNIIPGSKRLHAVEVVNDYKHIILEELDLQREAANTSQLHRNFEDSPLLYVPKIYWDYCGTNVMVAEKINGIPVTDLEALRKQGTDMKLLAERGVEIFFTQLFKHNFFHADMHPGNIFVSTQHPNNPQYIAVDCAIIGTLSEGDRDYLARSIIAMFRRDYHAVAQLHIDCGRIPKDSKVTDFEAAIRCVCEPIFNKPLNEISFARILLYLFQTARRFDMEVQPSLVLLQKTLLNIEGLGRQIYPQLDLWATAHPLMEEWLKERYTPNNVWKNVKEQAPDWIESLPLMPGLVKEALQQVKNLEQLGPTINSALSDRRTQEQRNNSQLQSKILGLVLISASIFTLNPEILISMHSISNLTWCLLGLGFYLVAIRQ